MELKYIKKFDMVNESSQEEGVADGFKPSESILVAYNTAKWSYDYDTQLVYAFLYMHKITSELTLTIVKSWIKTGIGTGVTTKPAETVSVGTVSKPDFSKIKETLKKYDLTSDRFTRKFTLLRWVMAGETEMKDYEYVKKPLSEILKNSKFQRIAKINDMEKEVTEETPKVEKTPYVRNSSRNFKLATIHKNLSKLSDAELDELLKKLV